MRNLTEMVNNQNASNSIESELKDVVSNTELCKQLEYHLIKQQTLCKSLERIADSLPKQADEQICLMMSRSIMPVIKTAHEFEEEILFPALLKQARQKTMLAPMLERLRYEHWEDESFGEEIAERLSELGMGRPYDPEKVGYMLRGFFEGLRRHIGFESDILLQILKSENENVLH